MSDKVLLDGNTIYSFNDKLVLAKEKSSVKWHIARRCPEGLEALIEFSNVEKVRYFAELLQKFMRTYHDSTMAEERTDVGLSVNVQRDIEELLSDFGSNDNDSSDSESEG